MLCNQFFRKIRYSETYCIIKDKHEELYGDLPCGREVAKVTRSDTVVLE